MHTDGLYLKHLGVTLAAIYRVETTPVSTLVGANVAVETLCRAMYGGLKLCQVGFVAVEAGVFLLHINCMKSDWYAEEKEREGCDELVHGDARYSNGSWRGNATPIL